MKNVIDLLPDLQSAGLVMMWEVKKGIDESAPAGKQPPTIVQFTTKDGCSYEIVASLNPRNTLIYDAGGKTWPSGKVQNFRSLVDLINAAGIHMFEPQRSV